MADMEMNTRVELDEELLEQVDGAGMLRQIVVEEIKGLVGDTEMLGKIRIDEVVEMVSSAGRSELIREGCRYICEEYLKRMDLMKIKE